MRALCLLLLIAACAPAQDQPDRDAWLRLFDGESLFGWTLEGDARAQVAGGVLEIPQAPGGWLRTNLPFADFDLRLEFQAGARIDSGLLLRGSEPGFRGYQIQLGDLAGDGFPTGSIVGVTRARRAPASPDGWNLLEVSVRGSSVTVRLNGRETASARTFQKPAGFVGIEAPAGGALRIRRLDLLPAGLAPLFNGRDLTGWRSLDSPTSDSAPAEWSVRDGILHVEKGPGQLETEAAWDDFVLQAEVRVNTIDPARHPNGGIFFRGDQESWWSGYESQIRNEFSGGDRAQPVDFGTGGIYRRQPARRVVPDDNRWFTKTIIASGRRIGVWIDGYQVADYLDPNPEGASVRDGNARLLRGTISIQAHDPSTNLDFRHLRIAPLPR